MPRHPHPPHRPPHLAGDDDYYHVPPPPHHRLRPWGLPIPEDFDEPVLRELMGGQENARAVRRIFEHCPDEIAMLAYLHIESFAKMREEMMTLYERIEQLEKMLREKIPDEGGG
jgi:hypothetical protein